MKKMKWISIKDKLPGELQTVWACNAKTGFVALACMVYIENEGWMWAISNGIIYSENRQIVSECEVDDNYDFTHWIGLPSLPI